MRTETDLIDLCREAMQNAVDHLQHVDDPANLVTNQLTEALHEITHEPAPPAPKNRLIEDGAGTWYVIPVSEVEDWYQWQLARAKGRTWQGTDYNEFRVNSPWEIRFDNWEAV